MKNENINNCSVFVNVLGTFRKAFNTSLCKFNPVVNIGYITCNVCAIVENIYSCFRWEFIDSYNAEKICYDFNSKIAGCIRNLDTFLGTKYSIRYECKPVKVKLFTLILILVDIPPIFLLFYKFVLTKFRANYLAKPGDTKVELLKITSITV